MSEQVLEKYMQRSREFAEQNKTGRECPYCGSSKTQTNRYGVFCAGCGSEKFRELATCFGVPVYDKDDFIALAKMINLWSPQ
jgi:NADH pyrophosphatase NudC (nudix superfamily)